jgi:hypothetical protein
MVDAGLLLDRVLDDEGLTAGLDEPEASLLVQVLSAQVQKLAAETGDEAIAQRQVDELCRTARRISDVVSTFRDAGEATARTTAGRYGFAWPAGVRSPTELVKRLLAKECQAS